MTSDQPLYMRAYMAERTCSCIEAPVEHSIDTIGGLLKSGWGVTCGMLLRLSNRRKGSELFFQSAKIVLPPTVWCVVVRSHEMVLSSSVLKGTPGIAVGSLRKVCTARCSLRMGICVGKMHSVQASSAGESCSPKQRLVRNVTFMYMFHLKPAVKKQL